MPFIAIAVVLALTLGGGVTVAADQAKPGDALYSYKVHVNDAVRHEYHALKASISGEAEADANIDAAGGIHLSGSDDADEFEDDYSTSTNVEDGLRVRSDADVDAKALDDKINADGSLEVNIR